MAISIVNNTGTNYTLYYNVLNYFKTIMSNHPTVQVASYGSLEEMDMNQFPAYPIANIDILDTNFGENTTNFTIQLTVADKVKNKNNESSGSTNAQTISYYKTDDTVDIHTNTLSVINDLTSFTQRGVQGFEINEDIVCEPFKDRFDNGLAGWQSTFTLTTHNDKNRCLFFLIPFDQGFIIENCVTSERFRALLDQQTYTALVGKVFSTLKSPGLSNTYGNLVCYTIVEPIPTDNWDFVNLPILQPGMIVDCPTCNLWINPKVWITTPAAWSGADAEFRTWATV
jgi:hypothetical protein